jgi:regulator of chromosome condensation
VTPFKERRIGKPAKVLLGQKAVKIASGFRHSFAITESGELYGWGYNNQQQLSHSEEFSHEVYQKHVMFEPIKISREMEGKRVVEVDGGKDFTVIITKDRKDIQEVWATGNNLRGQLGINRISHLQDMVRLDDVSGFVDSMTNKPLNAAHLT